MIGLVKTFAAACTPATVNGEQFCTGLPQTGATSANLQHIVQIVIGTFAVIAVLIIVIAGLNIVMAGGDPSKVAKARGAIIYALVGLVIAIMAESIVLLVIGHIK